MTQPAKLTWVEKLKGEFGLNQTLTLLKLPKSSWYYALKQQRQPDRYEEVKQQLKQIAKDHPEYGYRRTGAELNDSREQPINHKVVQRLMQEEELTLIRTAGKPPENPFRQILLRLGDKMNLYAPLVAQAESGEREVGVFTVFTTDFTELVYAQGNRKLQLIPVIDYASKYCAGFALGLTCTSELAIQALTNAAETVKRFGLSLDQAIMHHDRGGAFVSFEWVCAVLLVHTMKLSYALRGCKDNPAHESFNGRFKKENQDLFWECQTETELIRVVTNRIQYYNEERRHSSVGNMSPIDYIKKHGNGR